MGRKRGFEDVSSYTSNKMYRRNQKKKKHTGLMILLGFLFVLCIVFGGLLIYVSTYMLADLKTTVITTVPEELGITEETYTDESITNIALFGVDSRGNAKTFTGRSDVVMIMSVDKKHGKVKLASIMRDSRVYMGNLSPYGTGYDKLNHAYAYGGPEAAIRVINQNFGLDITDYATVNFAATAKIIDALGGADVELTSGEIQQMNNNLTNLAEQNASSLNGPIDLYRGSAGMAHLTGNQAVAYSRIRDIGNDNERVERQQEVISSLMNSLKDVSVLEYPNIIRELAPLCETSLDFNEMLDLSQIAIGGFTIERMSLPSEVEGFGSGNYEGGGWMWNYDVTVAAQHLHEFIYEDGADGTDE